MMSEISLMNMSFKLWLLSQVLLFYQSVSGEVPGPAGELREVRVLAKSRVLLPCNVTPETSTDAAILILFYNGVTGLPIYSIDARGGRLERPHHWSKLEERAHFNTAPGDHQGLIIESIQVDDAGSYRCRVDFRSSPTRNMRVKLIVVDPPQKITITDESGQTLSGIIGPYPVGSNLVLTCQVYGGVPPPRVVWWHENKVIDDVEDQRTQDSIQNVLALPKLTRQHLFRGLTCHAQNSNLTKPLAASVTLDMIFPPDEVRILGADNPLSAGEPSWVKCESTGSRPSATLSWWIDGAKVTDKNIQSAVQEGNTSRSELQLLPAQQHNGAMLQCRAENPLLQAAAIENTHKLSVYYSPKLTLTAGQNLDLSNIKEGDDVYFECKIQANPMVVKVKWFLNGRELNQNVTSGILISTQSLVLQKVVRTSSGDYTCQAANIHGKGVSDKIKLSVKFAPVCSPGQRWIYGGGRQHPVNVTCCVNAHPGATRFRWAFNTSSEYVDIPQSRIIMGKGCSMVAYTPQTHHDYGSLICWGVNEVGIQKVPCVYHIVPANPPDPVKNCSSWQNATASGEVIVSCQPGWGGGLGQTFLLEVQSLPSSPNDIHEHRVKTSLKDERKPYFTVTGLQPGKEYQIAVYASNDKGQSKPTYLIHTTPIDVAEKRTSVVSADDTEYVKETDPIPLLAILVGLVATLILCLVVLVIIVRKKKSRRQVTEDQTDNSNCEKEKLRKNSSEEKEINQQEERRPDVILIDKSEDQSAERDQLVVEYIRPRVDAMLGRKSTMMRANSIECKGKSDVTLHREPITSTVSIHTLQSPTLYQDPPPGSLPAFGSSTFSRRQLEQIPNAFVVSSSLSPTSPSTSIGFPPPPQPHHLIAKGSKAPSIVSSSAGPCSAGTRESCV